VTGFEVGHQGCEVGDGIHGAIIEGEAIAPNSQILKHRQHPIRLQTRGNPDGQGGMGQGKASRVGFPLPAASQGQNGLGAGMDQAI